MEAKYRYASADLNAKARQKVKKIAKKEKTTKAVMLGRLAEIGLAEYERLLAEGKDPHK